MCCSRHLTSFAVYEVEVNIASRMKEYGLWLAFYNVLFISLACLGKWLDVNKKLLFEHDQELTIDVEILPDTERNF